MGIKLVCGMRGLRWWCATTTASGRYYPRLTRPGGAVFWNQGAPAEFVLDARA